MSTSSPYDLLLLGVGHNGLTTAGFLAQAERPNL
jgi:phytoene dehydrogenase-like protein